MTLLKLIALEPSDLTVVAAHLQDAVIMVGDITYSNTARRFAALCNRLHRQYDAGGRAELQRRRAALRIDRVASVRFQGFLRDDRNTVLSVLTLNFAAVADPAMAPAGTLTIVCAGGASLQLDVECVELALEDLGPAWKAGGEPQHFIA